mmetsp:Transcript_1913/g.3908  ORF Transcript_1913/g.3908 Transcript_1913/m.3908 type:complete len:1340 (-) Transcript_1913:481-4500(-)
MNVGKNPKPPEGRYVAEPLVILGEEERSSDISNSFGRNSTSSAKGGSGTNGRAQLDAQQPSQPRTKFVASTFEFEPHSPSEFATDHSRITSFNDLFTTGMPSLDKMLRPNRSSNPACNSDEARKHGISTTNNSLDQTNDGSTVVSRSSNTSKGYSVSLFDNIQLTGANTNSISDAFLSADFNEVYRYNRKEEFKIKSSSLAHTKDRSNDDTSPNQARRRSNVSDNSSEFPHGENNDLDIEEEYLKNIIRKLIPANPEIRLSETSEVRLSGRSSETAKIRLPAVFASSDSVASNNSRGRVTQKKALGDTVHHIYKNPLLKNPLHESRNNSVLQKSEITSDWPFTRPLTNSYSTEWTQEQELSPTSSDRSFLPTELTRGKKLPLSLLDPEKHAGVDFNPDIITTERSGSENNFERNSWRCETEHSPMPKPKPLSTLWWDAIAIPFMAKIMVGRMWQLINIFTFVIFVFMPPIYINNYEIESSEAKVVEVILYVAIILHLLNMVLQVCILRLVVNHDRKVALYFAFTMDVLALLSPVGGLVIMRDFCAYNTSTLLYSGTDLQTKINDSWKIIHILVSVSGVAKVIQYDFGDFLGVVHKYFKYCRYNDKNKQEKKRQSKNDNRILFKLRYYKTNFFFENISFDMNKNCMDANSLKEEEYTKERNSSNTVSKKYQLNKKNSNSSLASIMTSGKSFPPEQSHKKSKMGEIMNDRTNMFLGIFILFWTVMSSSLSYVQRPTETNLIRSMLVLHNSLERNLPFAENSLRLARKSNLPSIVRFDVNGTCYCFDKDDNPKSGSCSCDCQKKPVVTLRINSTDSNSMFRTEGVFDQTEGFKTLATEWLISCVIVLIIWSFVAGRFTETLMVLIVKPMETMIQLLAILSQNPVGYKNMDTYKQFQEERKEKQVGWSEEVLLGMEINHLMKSIKTIANLLEVGFGSAGVEIISSNLEQGNSKILYLKQNGMRVLRIFLFCDIRQFTDTTEIMKHEIFFFVNKIAEVVHSICHSLEGAANKNIGDAFLIAWNLSDESFSQNNNNEGFTNPQESCQADKALLSVLKISIALYDEAFFLDSVCVSAKRAFKEKIYDGKGSLIKIGFGLSAGYVVQGTIGSSKKVDATYISENVDMAETLEGLTKSYKVPLLMSDAYYHLLSKERQMECRQVDQLYDKNFDAIGERKTIKIYTWDMDLDNYWRKGKIDRAENLSKVIPSKKSCKKIKNFFSGANQTVYSRNVDSFDTEQNMLSNDNGENFHVKNEKRMDALPKKVIHYDETEFTKLSKIRDKFDKSFFDEFNNALECYCRQDWRDAKKKFESMISKYDDGPSEYFLQEIMKNDGLPPRDFDGYGSI